MDSEPDNLVQKEAERAALSFWENSKHAIPGIILGVITGLAGRKLAIRFKLDIVSRIVLQLILLFAVSYLVQRFTTNYIDEAPKSTGNFQTFFFGVQVYLFMDIADLFGMRIHNHECQR